MQAHQPPAPLRVPVSALPYPPAFLPFLCSPRISLSTPLTTAGLDLVGFGYCFSMLATKLATKRYRSSGAAILTVSPAGLPAPLSETSGCGSRADGRFPEE